MSSSTTRRVNVQPMSWIFHWWLSPLLSQLFTSNPTNKHQTPKNWTLVVKIKHPFQHTILLMNLAQQYLPFNSHMPSVCYPFSWRWIVRLCFILSLKSAFAFVCNATLKNSNVLLSFNFQSRAQLLNVSALCVVNNARSQL